jgi:hypothetical protein
MVGVAGEGLRSVGVPISNQERLLYPAPRSPFTGRGSLLSVNPGPLQSVTGPVAEVVSQRQGMQPKVNFVTRHKNLSCCSGSFVASTHPHTLSPLARARVADCKNSLYRHDGVRGHNAHNTRRCRHPSPAVLGLSGWGRADFQLRLMGILGSSA